MDLRALDMLIDLSYFKSNDTEDPRVPSSNTLRHC